MAESLMLNIEDQERKPTQIEQDLIIEELTEKSSEVEQKQKKEMQKRMRNLIKNKYNNTPEISEPINTKILK